MKNIIMVVCILVFFGCKDSRKAQNKHRSADQIVKRLGTKSKNDTFKYIASKSYCSSCDFSKADTILEQIKTFDATYVIRKLKIGLHQTKVMEIINQEGYRQSRLDNGVCEEDPTGFCKVEFFTHKKDDPISNIIIMFYKSFIYKIFVEYSDVMINSRKLFLKSLDEKFGKPMLVEAKKNRFATEMQWLETQNRDAVKICLQKNGGSYPRIKWKNEKESLVASILHYTDRETWEKDCSKFNTPPYIYISFSGMSEELEKLTGKQKEEAAQKNSNDMF